MPLPAHSQRLDKPAAYSLPVAAGFSNTDLTSVTDYPNHAAQVVDFKNEGSEAQTVNWTDERGVAMTRVLSAGAEYTPLSPVASLVAAGTGANITAIAYWWPTPDHIVTPAP